MALIHLKVEISSWLSPPPLLSLFAVPAGQVRLFTMNKNSLSTNEEMLHGEFLTSLKGKYRAVFQIDCNLVIYGETALWHTDTAQTTGVRLVLQDNGALVMYTSKKTSVWETGSNSKELSQRMRLTLTDRGNLELTRDGELTWTSANSKGIKL